MIDSAGGGSMDAKYIILFYWGRRPVSSLLMGPLILRSNTLVVFPRTGQFSGIFGRIWISDIPGYNGGELKV